MNTATLFGLCGAVLAGFGVVGLFLHASWLRRIVSSNVLAAGIFMIFGTIARRGQEAGLTSDPVPQGMVITGVVVAFAATALAAALHERLTAARRAEANAAINGRNRDSRADEERRG